MRQARHPFAGTGGNGKFVKADIFEHPVSFAVESHANVGSPEEALSASLNEYGTVNIDYMREITDSTAEDLLTALKGRIYYNPLVTGYEIKDRFIAGNVIEKAERIEAWMGENPENERMPEVKEALEALKEAEPQRIAFEDLDFNFGERWIPTGVVCRLHEPAVRHRGENRLLRKHGRVFGGVRLPHHENHGRVSGEGVLPEL